MISTKYKVELFQHIYLCKVLLNYQTISQSSSAMQITGNWPWTTESNQPNPHLHRQKQPPLGSKNLKKYKKFNYKIKSIDQIIHESTKSESLLERRVRLPTPGDPTKRTPGRLSTGARSAGPVIAAVGDAPGLEIGKVAGVDIRKIGGWVCAYGLGPSRRASYVSNNNN